MDQFSTGLDARLHPPTQNRLTGLGCADYVATSGARDVVRHLGAPRSGAEAPRLGSSAHFDRYADAVPHYPGPAYLAVAKDYGPNGGQVVLRSIREAPQRFRPGDTQGRLSTRRTGEPRAGGDPYALQRAAYRAKSDIRDWILMVAKPGCSTRLCTLTKRGGIDRLDQAWQLVGRFRRQVARHYPSVEFIAVPELHKGSGVNHGTLHVHLLMVFPAGAWPVYSVFHRMWYRALGGSGGECRAEAPGNCDFAPHKPHYTAWSAARYLSKYVTKDLELGNYGQRRFSTSHAMPKVPVQYWWEGMSLDHRGLRRRALRWLQEGYPGYEVRSHSFNCGGDTYHLLTAEPVISSARTNPLDRFSSGQVPHGP